MKTMTLEFNAARVGSACPGLSTREWNIDALGSARLAPIGWKAAHFKVTIRHQQADSETIAPVRRARVVGFAFREKFAMCESF